MFEHKSSYKVLLRSSFPSPALWPKPKREQRAPLGMLWESSAMQGKVRPTQTKVSNDALGTDAADFLCFGCFLTCMCMWVFVGVCWCLLDCASCGYAFAFYWLTYAQNLAWQLARCRLIYKQPTHREQCPTSMAQQKYFWPDYICIHTHILLSIPIYILCSIPLGSVDTQHIAVFPLIASLALIYWQLIMRRPNHDCNHNLLPLQLPLPFTSIYILYT